MIDAVITYGRQRRAIGSSTPDKIFVYRFGSLCVRCEFAVSLMRVCCEFAVSLL